MCCYRRCCCKAVYYRALHLSRVGLGQQCGVELIVPETVIASVRPELSDLIQEVTAKLGSHLTNGEAVDVGEF